MATRVSYVWIYNNTNRSVFSAILYHDIDNLSWLTFPVGASYFDPRVTGLIVLCLAIVVVVAPRKRLSRPSGAPT